MASRISVDGLSRWVWLINGVLLLAAIMVTLVVMLVGWLTQGRRPLEPVESAALAPALRPAAEIRYDAPIPIGQSGVSLVLMRDGRGLPSEPLPGAGAGRTAGPVVNAALIDRDGTGRLLLDRPARIAWVSFPGAPDWMAGPLSPDAGQEWIAWAILDRDRDGDGRLEAVDGARLFVSTLEGRELRPALPGDLQVTGLQRASPTGWMITALDSARRQKAFLFDGRSARPHAILDSLALRAGELRNGGS